MAIVYALYGFTGSGKTTYAKKLAAETTAFLMSHDAWMAALYGDNPGENYAIYYKRIKDHILNTAADLLARDVDIILDWGFWSRAERDELRAWAADQGGDQSKVDLRLIWLDAPMDVMKERVLKRTSENHDDQVFIDENAFNEFKARFEPLGTDEVVFEKIQTG